MDVGPAGVKEFHDVEMPMARRLNHCCTPPSIRGTDTRPSLAQKGDNRDVPASRGSDQPSGLVGYIPRIHIHPLVQQRLNALA